MFENLIMLAGLGGAVVPLVIHLLSRARYRTTPWGAMMFLEPASQRQHVGRLREWSLLAVRMAAVGLLAIALARPVAGELTAAAEPKRVAAIIIIDCSGSMSRIEAGQTRLAMARQGVLKILSSLRRGDRVALLAAGGQRQEPSFTGDLQAVAARVNELQASATTADLATALSAAIDAMGQQETSSRRLYLITDHQALNWSVLEHEADVLRARVAKLTAEFLVIPVGGTDAQNVAIESLALLNEPAIAGCQSHIEITVRNHGRSARWGLPVTLRIGGRDVHTGTINVKPRQTARVTASVVMPAEGAHVLAAQVFADGDADDRLERVLDVVAPPRVLIVRETSRARPDYLLAALTPRRSSGAQGADIANVQVVSYDEWNVRALAEHDVLVLDDVRALEPWEARVVEQFVYGGGGLIVAPGPAARIEEYNRLLYRDETGLLPALLQPAISPQPAQRLDPATVDPTHALTQFMRGQSDVSAGSVQRYFPLTARTPTANVIAALGSGEPLLMETPFGAGRVIVMTSTLDARWNTLPLMNIYLPLMQSSVRYLARVGGSSRNVPAGQELVATFSPPLQSARATVIRPDGTRDSAEVIHLEERSEARYGQSRLPGVYVIRPGPRGGERAVTFAVSPASEESSVQTLDEAQWSALERRLGFERAAAEVGATAAAHDAGTGTGWMAALVGVLALLVIELAMTRRWSMQGVA